MSDLVEFIPHNMQEHDDMLRAIANKHMGAGQGNVSVWVIQALHEAYKRGFGLGYTTAQRGGPMASGNPPALHKAMEFAGKDAKRIPAGGTGAMTKRIVRRDDGTISDIVDVDPKGDPK